MKEVWYFKSPHNPKGETYLLPVTMPDVIYKSAEGPLSSFKFHLMPKPSKSYRPLGTKEVK